MPAGGKRKGSGRKKFIIDYETVEKLAQLMCTQSEIASYLGCSINKLEKDKKFQEVHKKGIDQGKMSLRRQQVKLFMDGNATMGIWLGKQYLDQRDKKDVDLKETHIVVELEDDDDEPII